MNIIVAVDKNWGIGKDNDLLFCLPLDLKHFKDTTLNKVVVMGSNTLRSLPNGKPLKNRTNIVLSTKNFDAEKNEFGQDFIHCKDHFSLFSTLKNFNIDDIFIIGGAKVYADLLPFCKAAIVTKVDADGGASHYFSDLDKNPDWTVLSKSDPIQDLKHNISFWVYKNINKKEFKIY